MNRTPFLLFLLVLIFQSCISSRHDVRVPCNDDIRNTTLLVPEIRGLSTRQSERIFNVVEDELSGSGTRLLYYPREEWNLASNGVIRNDFEFMTKLASQGIPFLLIVDVIESHSGLTVDYINADQVRSRFGPPTGQFVPPEPNANNKSVSILISILSTVTRKSVYKSVTKTNISAMTFREQNGGEYEINGASTGVALQKAVRKGMRNLERKCLAH
jgi:hypothetical protein